MEPGMRLIMYTQVTNVCTSGYMGSKSGSCWEKLSLASHQCVLSLM